MPEEQELSSRKIFSIWWPLALTWLMMAIEGPFICAIIARLAEPKFNLAAFGISFSIILLFESPIFLILGATTTLVQNRLSYIKLRNFTTILSALLTLILVVLFYPVPFSFICDQILDVPPAVSSLARSTGIVLLPLPFLVGYRRFYQGVLIRFNLSSRVALATLVRLISMSLSALILFFLLNLPGATTGAIALLIGIVLEAIVSRCMAHKVVNRLMEGDLSEQHKDIPISYGTITKFYTPLALTGVLAMGVHPILTFFLARGASPIESLAVFPVINYLQFLFKSIGLSFQEVIIANIGSNNEGAPVLKNFAKIIAVVITVMYFLLAFTPLSYFWFHTVSGLPMELTNFAILPTQLLIVLPALSIWLVWQRAVLMQAKTTAPITAGTVCELVGAVSAMFILVHVFGVVGAIAGAVALSVGRLMNNLFIIKPQWSLKRVKERTVVTAKRN